MTKGKGSSARVRGIDIIGGVGGPVDEARLTLGIHGPDLEPNEITALLGCTPTSAHRRGEERRRSPPYSQGGWLLSVVAKAPVGLDELVRLLFARLPQDSAQWELLATRYTIRVSFGIFVGGWNRGFELSPASLRQLAMLGVPVGFDIYVDGEE